MTMAGPWVTLDLQNPSGYARDTMSQSSLLKYLEAFHRLGAETAYVQRNGYRSIRWSYRDVSVAAGQFARELDARGIGEGDRVVIWGRNCAEWVAAFIGCVWRGAVAVPMDLIASPDFAMRVFDQVEAALWVCSRDQAKHVSGQAPVILEDLPSFLAHHSGAPYPSPEINDGTTLQIVFTSGTTAEPKGVVISHRNVVANLEPLAREIRKYLKYERPFHPLRFLALLPLSHVFGQFMSIFVPPLLAGTVVFSDSLNPSDVIATIKRERVSVVISVPRLLESLRDKIQRDMEIEGRLERFRSALAAAEGRHFLMRWWSFRKIHRKLGWKFWAFISGGAALDQITERFWGRLGFAVIQGYGLTETTSLISVNHPFKLSRGSIGRVLPGRELKLDSNGEILVKGDNIAAGYYQSRKMEPVSGHEGWFHTGDMGEVDAEGNLYFKGRKKSVIVTPEGMKVYPEDLEGALRRQAQVRDCVVIGIAREGNAEACAVLILSGGPADPKEIVRAANESLADYQRIRRWFIWPEEDFPRTSTHKPRLNVIQEIVRSRLEGESMPAPSSGGLADLLMRITGKPVSALSPDANLASDLNLSSVDRVELLSAIEDRFQLDLNETRFTSATTVRELEEMLLRPVPERSDYAYPRWAQRWPVLAIRLAVYYMVTLPATRLMVYPKIRGRENLRGQQGPLLFVSNHITQVDVGFILAALPSMYRHRLAVAMWGELLESMRCPAPGLGFFQRVKERFSYWSVVALFNVFPLPQTSGFRESFAFAGEAVDRGYSVLVFPEGQRTKDGRLSPFRAGIGMLAAKLNLPVVPLRIDGLYELKKRNQKFAPTGTVVVTIGSPFTVNPDPDPERIARDLERRVASLEYRGELH